MIREIRELVIALTAYLQSQVALNNRTLELLEERERKAADMMAQLPMLLSTRGGNA